MSITSTIRRVVPTYGYSTPTTEQLWQAYEQTKFTPDISKLEEYEWQLYFATDDTKKDHHKHSLLGDDAEYRFPGYTVKNFHYWDHEAPFLTPIPMKIDGEQFINNLPFNPPIAKIRGQVFLIRPQRFMELDTYKENTVQYYRERVRLTVPYRAVKFLKEHHLDPAFGVQTAINRENYTGSSVVTTEETTCILRAWMYIGRPSFWDPLISAYDYKAVESFNSKNRRWCSTYYHIRRPNLPPK